MKQKVLVSVQVTCDPPWTIGRWSLSLEEKAQHLESWCREFEAFIRDHRSQDPVGMSVERVYQEQCSYCDREWELDADGPTCCNAAQAEWDKEKVASL